MTYRPLPENERLQQLLADRATQGLSNAEMSELETLLREFPDVTGDELDLAAAALFLSAQDTSDAMPPSLKDRVEGNANEFFAGGKRPASTGSGLPTRLSASAGVTIKPLRSTWQSAGWFAAAAAIVIAAIGWLPRGGSGAKQPIPLDEQVKSLIASANDEMTTPWAPPSDPKFAGVKGDVVWSSAKQQGFMRLAGMPVNDAKKEQYQLWIVDPNRDKHPIDGGVFDVDRASGELIIPIQAKLPVGQPAAFAITLEKPGGVVVSAGPLLVVASVTQKS